MKYVKSIDNIHICVRCATLVSDSFNEIRNRLIEKRVEKYNIGDVDDTPVKVCKCSTDEILPFTFYSYEYKPDNYYTVLCGTCRGCGGFKEVPLIYDRTPILLLEPPLEAGLKIFTLEKETKGADYYT